MKNATGGKGFGSGFQAWKAVMLTPAQFYRSLPNLATSRPVSSKTALFRALPAASYRQPAIFYLKMQALLLGLLYAFFLLAILFFLSFAGGALGMVLAPLLSLGVAALLIIAVLAFPLLLLLAWGGLYLNAGILHLFVRLLGGKKPYAETFAVVGYSVAPAIFSFIPLLNYAAAAYSLVLNVIGVHVRQNLSLGRSIGAVLLPFAILVLLYGLLVVAVMGVQ